MKISTRNRLTMGQRALVSARLPAAAPGVYSWVWVLPLPDGRFRVAAIEIPERLVDDDECFGEDAINTRFLRVVDDVDEVDGAVREAGGDPEELTAPWHNDFPL
ncbi:MAG: hypothetical protein M3Z75_30635 [Actinomycetota bacterium]|nr:hypothetical protein [Actinomycetota bacterium]